MRQMSPPKFVPLLDVVKIEFLFGNTAVLVHVIAFKKSEHLHANSSSSLNRRLRQMLNSFQNVNKLVSTVIPGDDSQKV